MALSPDKLVELQETGALTREQSARLDKLRDAGRLVPIHEQRQALAQLEQQNRAEGRTFNFGDIQDLPDDQVKAFFTQRIKDMAESGNPGDFARLASAIPNKLLPRSVAETRDRIIRTAQAEQHTRQQSILASQSRTREAEALQQRARTTSDPQMRRVLEQRALAVREMARDARGRALGNTGLAPSTQELASEATGEVGTIEAFARSAQISGVQTLASAGQLLGRVTEEDREALDALRIAAGRNNEIAAGIGDFAGAVTDPVFLGLFGSARTAIAAGQAGRIAALEARMAQALGGGAKAQRFAQAITGELVDSAAGAVADAPIGAVQGGSRGGLEGAVKGAATQTALGAVLGPVVGLPGRLAGGGRSASRQTQTPTARGPASDTASPASQPSPATTRASAEAAARSTAEANPNLPTEQSPRRGTPPQSQPGSPTAAPARLEGEQSSPIVGEAKEAVQQAEVRQALDDAAIEAEPMPHPTQTTLSGGRRAGGSLVVGDVADEIVAAGRNIAELAMNFRRDAPQLARRVAQRASNFIRQTGEAGRALTKQMQSVDQRAAKVGNNNNLDYSKAIHGLNKKQRELMSLYLNGRITAKEAGSQIVRRADQAREILDRDLDTFIELGGRRRVRGQKVEARGSGKPFPQMPNSLGRQMLDAAKADGLANPHIAAAAEQMVRNGQAPNAEIALKRLLDFREQRLKGVNLYLESDRVELPREWVEWDPAIALRTHFHRNAIHNEAIREWGHELEKADSLIQLIAADTDGGTAGRIRDFLSIEAGKGLSKVPGADRRIAASLSNFETITKLGFSPLSAMRNLFQRFGNTAMYPLSVQIRAARDFPPLINAAFRATRQVAEEVERTGAVRAGTSLTEIEAGVAGERITDLALRMFSRVERGNQVYSALVAKHGIERDIARLIELDKADTIKRAMRTLTSLGGDSRGAIERRLQRVGLTREKMADILESGRKLTTDEIETAMHLLVTDTQFPLTMMTRRLWWTANPWLRLLGKFKPFGLDQVGLLYRTAWRELVKGNPAPAARMMVAMTLAGEIYNIARDMILGSEESITVSTINDPNSRNPRAIGERLMANLADGGGVGMMADLGWGVTNYLKGPALSTLQNVLTAASDTVRRPEQIGTVIRDFIESEVVIDRQIQGGINQIEGAIGDANIAIDYKVWRDRGFDWDAQKKGDNTKVDKVAESLTGFSQFARTDRTLSHEYAARNVIVGDVDDAATYLERIFSEATTNQELRDLVTSARQSAAARAPLGNVSQKDLPEFLSQYPQEERQEAIRLHRQFMSNYEAAISEAVRRVMGRE